MRAPLAAVFVKSNACQLLPVRGQSRSICIDLLQRSRLSLTIHVCWFIVADLAATEMGDATLSFR